MNQQRTTGNQRKAIIQVDPATGTVAHRGPVPAGETWLPVSTMKTEDLLVLLPASGADRSRIANTRTKDYAP